MQKQLSARKNCSTPKINGGGFVLSGILVCGHCGHRMTGDTANQVHNYTCYGYRQRGRAYCEPNYIKQREVVERILGAIKSAFYNPETLERLAAECRRQLVAKDSGSEAATLRKELADVDTKLTKAKRRLVEVDADLLDDVQQQIRQLKGRRSGLAAMLKEASTSPAKRFSDIDAKVKAALAWFASFKAAAAELLRMFLREAIEKVEVFPKKTRWTAKRFKYELARGIVHFKPVRLLSTVR